MKRIAAAALVRRILLGGALALCGCTSTPACPRMEMTIPVSPDLPGAAADGGLENELTLCLADQSACDRLCQRAVPPDPPAPGYTLSQCSLAHVDGGFAVQVVYTAACPD